MTVPPATFADYRRWLAAQVDIINQAIAGLPADRIRYHVCWGSWPGPHVSDVPLKDIVDLILKVKVGAYVIEGVNPRHEHGWQVWKNAKLGAGQVLIPGVISHATNVVEHPELVAERIVRLAKIVGRENVIAGTDCGFAQGPLHRRVPSWRPWWPTRGLRARNSGNFAFAHDLVRKPDSTFRDHALVSSLTGRKKPAIWEPCHECQCPAG